MTKSKERLIAEISTVLVNIAKLNLMIFKSANNSEHVRNLAKGISNSLSMINELVKEDMNIKSEGKDK